MADMNAKEENENKEVRHRRDMLDRVASGKLSDLQEFIDTFDFSRTTLARGALSYLLTIDEATLAKQQEHIAQVLAILGLNVADLLNAAQSFEIHYRMKGLEDYVQKLFAEQLHPRDLASSLEPRVTIPSESSELPRIEQSAPRETSISASGQKPSRTTHLPYVGEGGWDSVWMGTGRRKSAVASVRVKHRPGSGVFIVNKKPLREYFVGPVDVIEAPLEACALMGKVDVMVRVKGGGVSGQASAIQRGLAVALGESDPEYHQRLREGGFITSDSRRVERKKFGKKKARKGFQFSKR
jgi:small subunit ribosomal protein S9